MKAKRRELLVKKSLWSHNGKVNEISSEGVTEKSFKGFWEVELAKKYHFRALSRPSVFPETVIMHFLKSTSMECFTNKVLSLPKVCTLVNLSSLIIRNRYLISNHETIHPICSCLLFLKTISCLSCSWIYFIPLDRKYYTVILKLIQQLIKHQLLLSSCPGEKNIKPFMIFKS